MAKLEHNLDCPVCLGVVMDKSRPAKDVDLVIDHCRRCGGVWFDSGELDLMRQVRPHEQGLITPIQLSKSAYEMKCHSCQATMDRNAEKCPSCGWKNVIYCPVCQHHLRPVEKSEVKLDVCTRCKGAWFDNTELAHIWNQAAKSSGKAVQQETRTQDHFILNSIIMSDTSGSFGGGSTLSPGLAPGGAGEVSGSSVLDPGDIGGSGPDVGGSGDGSALDEVGDFAGSLVEGAGELAGFVVEGTGEVAGAFFGGIGAVLEGVAEIAE